MSSDIIVKTENNLPSLKHQYSQKDIMVQEYKRCLVNPAYFMKNYCYIVHPKKGKIRFKLYDFQQKVLQQLMQHSWNIILKSRQLGISTLCANYALWFLLFFSNKSIIVIANKSDVAKNLIRKIKLAYDMLPNWLKVQLITDNKQSLEFANGSFIKAQSANPDAGRSQALSLLIIDQCAIIRNNLAETIWESAGATLSCIQSNSTLTIRNKKTKQIQNITIEQFYKRIGGK